MTDQPQDQREPISLTGDEVKAIRDQLGLTSSELAGIVQIYGSSSWRTWQRNGVKGPAAVLLWLLRECPPARQLLISSRNPRA